MIISSTAALLDSLQGQARDPERGGNGAHVDPATAEVQGPPRQLPHRMRLAQIDGPGVGPATALP
ncbi:hypothetical protein [Streptomyces shenzhenensis]|uniref:hypothetical protein n=1 Tax=Streptomyces shenzhenensis TaxID=943815 RepID=UPI0033D8404E